MDTNTHLLIKVAKLYYEAELTQDAIANKLRISRPKVSRLLQEARNEGFVQISIASPPGSFDGLERQLEEKYQLTEVVVVEVSDADSSMALIQELGTAAADYFRRTVRDGDLIGFTWGNTLAAMVDAIIPEKRQRVQVIQMVGGLGEPSAEVHTTEIVRKISKALDANLQLLPAPGIVGKVEIRKILLEDRYIRQSIEMSNKADLAFVGVGSPVPDSVLMRDESILTWKEVNELKDMGAVGEIGLHFFTLDGKPVDSEVEERVIGIGLDELRALPRVVGIAGGKAKFEAILGCVRGKFINTLITDQITAQNLLDIS